MMQEQIEIREERKCRQGVTSDTLLILVSFILFILHIFSFQKHAASMSTTWKVANWFIIALTGLGLVVPIQLNMKGEALTKNQIKDIIKPTLLVATAVGLSDKFYL